MQMTKVQEEKVYQLETSVLCCWERVQDPLAHGCTHSLPSISRGTDSSSTSGPMAPTAAPTAWSTSAV